MFRFKKSLTAALLICATGQAMAATNTGPWKGEAELGVVSTTGNTDNRSVKARAGVVHEQNQWRHTGLFDALYTSAAKQTTAERYLLSGKSDFKFDEFNYVFGMVSYDADRFAGYDYRVSEIAGYGRRLINQSNLMLDVEIGPGARQTKLKTGETEHETVGRAAGNLIWKISPSSATFSENLSSEFGSKATITRSVTALSAQVVGSLAMKLSYTVRNISKVPAPAKKTDTETALTLVYGF